jgi:hypothetical protein
MPAEDYEDKVVFNCEEQSIIFTPLTPEEVVERDAVAADSAIETAIGIERQSKLELGVTDIQDIFSETWFQDKLKGKHYNNIADIASDIQTDFGFTVSQANFLARVILGLYATWLILYDVRDILDPYVEG